MSNENVVILRKELETVYITEPIRTIMVELFEQYTDEFKKTNNKITVDTQGCKFIGYSHLEFITYKDTINFINSTDEYINEIFEHNTLVLGFQKAIKNKLVKIVDLPTELDSVQLLTYIEDINKDYVYRVISNNENKGAVPVFSIYLAMFIQMRKPEVEIDLSDQTVNYFRCFNEIWNYHKSKKRNSYYVLWDNNILKIDAIKDSADDKYKFYIPGVGPIEEESLINNYTVIPYIFSNVKYDVLNNEEDFKEFPKEVAKRLQESVKSIDNRKIKKILKDALKSLEGSGN